MLRVIVDNTAHMSNQLGTGQSLRQRLRAYVDIFVFGSPHLWRCYIHIVIFWAKIHRRIVNIQHRSKAKPLANLLEKLRASSDTCHILGNGICVNLTKQYIRDSDFVIAINSGGLHPLPIGMLITELHPLDDPTLLEGKISIEENIQMTNQLYDKVIRDNPDCILVLKNIWRNNVSPDIYDENNRLHLLPEFLYENFPQDSGSIAFQKFCINHILNIENDIVVQIYSSVLTAITVAYKAGFKEIYIHGLSGGGAHFFHAPLFDTTLNVADLEILKYLQRLLPKAPDDAPYVPGLLSSRVLQLFIDVAAESGVSILRCGDEC